MSQDMTAFGRGFVNAGDRIHYLTHVVGYDEKTSRALLMDGR